MREHITDISSNNDALENIFYIQRPKIPDIEAFVSKNLEKMESLDYYIDHEFTPSELIDVLKQDLPNDVVVSSNESFINDIVSISGSFFATTKSKKIRIQIEIVKNDMCRLFHVDKIKQRLVCTYNGPGTQWIENSNVNRQELGSGDNEKIVKDQSEIKQATPFDILILRGDKFRSHNFDGAVHRSPPIQSTGAKRVILKIDEC